jgi:hypothetical protein
MRIHDGRYECAYCGELNIPLSNEPQVTIRAAGGEPNFRSLTLNGEELHSCVIGAMSSSGSANK